MFPNDRLLWDLSKSVGQCCRTCLLKVFMVSYFIQCFEHGLLNLLTFGDAESFCPHILYDRHSFMDLQIVGVSNIVWSHG